MYYYNKYVLGILDRYLTHTELIDSQPVAFTSTANEKAPLVFTTETNADTLYFGAAINIENPDVLVRIKSISPSYEWMSNNNASPQDTPIGALFGTSTQVLPVLPLVMPFFVQANGRLQMQFTNSPSDPSGPAVVTWRLLKLVGPKQNPDGTSGWDYGFPPLG